MSRFRFSVGPWNVNEGVEAFGPAVRPVIALEEKFKKFKEIGELGLEDKRGHHKNDAEIDELERLRRENLRLKRQLEEKDRVCELLKKVMEFERM